MKSLSNYSQVEKLLMQQARGATGRLSDGKRAQMKDQVLASIRATDWIECLGYGALVSSFNSLAQERTPSAAFKADLREKLYIMTQLDTRHKRVARHSEKMHRHSLIDVLFQLLNGTMPRRLTAAGLLSLFIIALAGNLVLSPSVTYARSQSTLEDVSGSVTVKRGGAELQAYDGFVLNESDVVTTAQDSKVSVRFIDESIGRLSENTALHLVSQHIDQFNQAQSVVEVVLDRGRFWTRVVNLIDNNSRFEVKTPSVTAVAKRRAAFDVEVSDLGSSRITAIHNRVDVRVANSSRVVETTLVKGYSANITKLNGNYPVITPTPLAVLTPTVAEAKSDAWVADNLSKDIAYIAQVKEDGKQAVRDQAGTVPGNPFYTLEQLSDSTSLALTISAAERNKKLLALAEKKIGQAAILLEQGNANAAQDSLNGFLSDIEQVALWIKGQQEESPEDVIEVKALLESLISQSHKHFSLVLPTDVTYLVKEAVSQAELLIADSPVSKTAQQLNSATEKLIEAHDLAEQGNTPLATQQIAQYNSTLNGVVNTLKQLPPTEKEKVVEVLLDAKKEDIKTLEVIKETHSPVENENALEQSTLNSVITQATAEHNDIQKQVTEAKKDSLTQIGEAVLDTQKGLTSPELLQKIEDIQNVDVNGKSLIEVRVSSGKLLMKNDTTTVITSAPVLITPVATATAAQENTNAATSVPSLIGVPDVTTISAQEDPVSGSAISPVQNTVRNAATEVESVKGISTQSGALLQVPLTSPIAPKTR